ncbi:MAG TPA: hypothetical protein VHC49_06425 [Mycobacteriales bacterium]|nr:hypothetical protein [Mycobacteriales bacterium]
MPAWLRVICDWNPVSAVAASCRELFGNPGTDIGHHALPLDHPVLATVIWSAGLLLIFAPLSARSFLRAER